MREIVLIHGNCQSRMIARQFESLRDVAERFEVVFFRNYQFGHVIGDSDGFNRERTELRQFVEANRSRIRLFVRQMTHGWFDDGLSRSDFDRRTDIVDFPVALLNYIWPLSSHGPAREEVTQFQARRFPYCLRDSEVGRLKAEGVSERDLVQRYFEIDVVKKYRVDRLKTLHDFKANEVDMASTFPIAAFVQSQMMSVQMFRTENHPDGPLMAEILRQIGLNSRTFENAEDYAQMVDKVRVGHGVQKVEAPVHPAIAEHFGLAWAKDKRFSFWGYLELTFEEYLHRMYTLEADEEFHSALTAFRADDLAQASVWIDRALARLPGDALYMKLHRRIARRIAQDRREGRRPPAVVV